jgi:hypothetical protein
MRPWNEKIEQRAFWDTEANGGKGADFLKVQSLKDALKNPNGMKFEDLLRTVSDGLAMVMDVIDQDDYYFHRHQEHMIHTYELWYTDLTAPVPDAGFCGTFEQAKAHFSKDPYKFIFVLRVDGVFTKESIARYFGIIK